MPLETGSSKAVIRKNTSKLIHEGYEPDQAYAIANNNAHRFRRDGTLRRKKRRAKKKHVSKSTRKR